ncbi:MAG: hypothetical protein KDC87_13115 [Planctomycetes bacterium]|nr:hypothetical protein [Planctomycetota bacterium]
MSRCLLPVSFLACCIAAPVAAQVPDGWAVISYVGTGMANIPNGGLTLLHPRTKSSAQVTGLPIDLTGGANDGIRRGAGSVYVDAEGDLWVGEVGPPGTSIELFRLRLSGNAATVVSKTTVGSVAPSSLAADWLGITGISVLRDGDVLFSVAGLQNSAPLNGARLARLSRTNGTVTPIPTAGVQGDIVASVASRDGKFAYLHAVTNYGGRNPIVEVPLAGGTARTIFGAWVVHSMFVDAQGFLLITNSTYVLEIDPNTNAFRGLGGVFNATTRGVVAAFGTGNPLVFASDTTSSSGGYWFTDRRTLQHTMINYAGGDTVTDMAIRQAVQPYGTSTSGNRDYAVSRAFTATGLPLTGNGAFSFAVDSTVPQTAGFLTLCAAQASTRLLGVDVHVDLSRVVALVPVLSNTPLTLPIPGSVPAPTAVFLQAFFDDIGAPQRIGASEGLRIGVVR